MMMWRAGIALVLDVADYDHTLANLPGKLNFNLTFIKLTYSEKEAADQLKYVFKIVSQPTVFHSINHCSFIFFDCMYFF